MLHITDSMHIGYIASILSIVNAYHVNDLYYKYTEDRYMVVNKTHIPITTDPSITKSSWNLNGPEVALSGVSLYISHRIPNLAVKICFLIPRRIVSRFVQTKTSDAIISGQIR